MVNEEGRRQRRAQREKRVADALGLRGTCVTCGHKGLDLTPNPQKKAQYAPKCACGGRGHLAAEIGQALGIPTSTVGVYLADPSGEDARARRARYRGTCGDCGGPTDDRTIPRCLWCMIGKPSPHVLENSPTGFASRETATCGFGGCTKPRTNTPPPGSLGLMCDEHSRVIASIRDDFNTRERHAGDRYGRRARLDLDDTYDHMEAAD